MGFLVPDPPKVPRTAAVAAPAPTTPANVPAATPAPRTNTQVSLVGQRSFDALPTTATQRAATSLVGDPNPRNRRRRTLIGGG